MEYNQSTVYHVGIVLLYVFGSTRKYKNDEEYKIRFGDEKKQFVDNSAMIISIEWQHLFVLTWKKSLVCNCMEKDRVMSGHIISSFLSVF